jgi:uncharacterized membrane protein YdjX (TVP38/TMEM64 family)
MKNMTPSKKAHIAIEAACIAAVAVLALCLLSVHTPKILLYLENDDISGMTSYIRGEGRLGEAVLIGLQALETLSIFLPALPVYICAGIIYGRVEGILICYITNLVLNAIMFTFARRSRGSSSLIPDFGKNPKVDQIMSRVKDPGKAVIVISLIPVVPNGTIPFIAAQTDITLAKYIRSLAVGCLPAISLNVICGDALLTINWKVFLPVIVVLAIAAAVIYLSRKKIADRLGKRFEDQAQKAEEPEENKA